MGKRGRQR
jgi:hypothetical protein